MYKPDKDLANYILDNMFSYVIFFSIAFAAVVLREVQDIRVILFALFGMMFLNIGLFMTSLDTRFPEKMKLFLRRIATDSMVSWGMCLVYFACSYWKG